MFAVAGCEDSVVGLFTCKHPDLTYMNPKGEPDPCHRDSAGCKAAGLDADVETCVEPSITDLGQESAEGCDGKCIPSTASPWVGPVLIWFGPSDQEPLCPAETTMPDNRYFADPEVPSECSCGCEPSAGSCALSSTLTASTVPCYQPGGKSLSFDAPAGWTGACTAQNAIPASAGVQSLNIAPLALKEGDCQPASSPPTRGEVKWKTVARSCRWPLTTACKKTLGLCAPSPAPPPQFSTCVVSFGDHPCPEDYQDKSLFFESNIVKDDRLCAPCSCGGAPQGSRCVAQVSVYQNDVCAATPPISHQATSDKGLCVDVASSTALQSKSADPPTYIPGICSEGSSELMGDLKMPGSISICCLREQPGPT